MSTIRPRQATLDRLNQHRATIRLPLEDVRNLSQWLRSEYGIRHFNSPEDFVEEAEATLGESECRTLDQMFEDRYEAGVREGDTAGLDVEFYQHIARDPVSGLVHSMKRSFILDAAALVTVILRETNCPGPVLDAGCNVGYHAAWLAHHLGVEVLGIDRSPAAIEYARNKTREQSRCNFQHAELENFADYGRFECVFVIDAFADDPDTFAAQFERIAQGLPAGGMLIVLDNKVPQLPENTRVTEIAAENELGYCLSDLVGGLHGCDVEDARWSWKAGVVFVKGNRRPLPPGLREGLRSEWAAFAEYANTAGVPEAEKTQAFFRANAQR